jgi:hypothetical protein
MKEQIIDRSLAQKAARIELMRLELTKLGYSIVTTEWLNAVMREMPTIGTPPKQQEERQ